MKQINAVCKSVGVTKRTLQHYDDIGLLSPTKRTDSGYRLYDDAAIEKLWQILLLKEFGYSLDEIKHFMNNPEIDLRDSIGHRIDAMKKKKMQLENLIGFAQIIKFTGVIPLSFEEYGDVTFDDFINGTQKSWNMNMLSEYSERIGDNPLNNDSFQELLNYINEHLNGPEKELDVENKNRITELIHGIANFDQAIELQQCIDRFSTLTDMTASSNEVQEHVEMLYTCINNLFGQSMSLNGFLLYGQTLVARGDVGIYNTNRLGEETTEFIFKAIQIYHNNNTAERT